MVDILNQLQALVTKTATFNGAGLDLVTGTPRRGLKARVLYSAATNASGSNSVTWTIDASSDNSTFQTIATGETVLALSTTAQSGEFYIPIETSLRYVRVSVVIAGAGSTPTVSYQVDISLARP